MTTREHGKCSNVHVPNATKHTEVNRVIFCRDAQKSIAKQLKVTEKGLGLDHGHTFVNPALFVNSILKSLSTMFRPEMENYLVQLVLCLESWLFGMTCVEPNR